VATRQDFVRTISEGAELTPTQERTINEYLLQLEADFDKRLTDIEKNQPVHLTAQWTVPAGNTLSSKTFQIPASGVTLFITFSLWADDAADNSVLQIRMNGDSGNNYNWQFVRGQSAVLDGGWTAGADAYTLVYLPDSDATSGLASSGFVFIQNYNSTLYKQIVALCGSPSTAQSFMPSLLSFGGNWASTEPVRSITFFNVNNKPFGEGSVFSIYIYD